jgi:hypothetical protein
MLVQPRHLGRLATRQHHVVRSACTRNSFYNARDLIDAQTRARDVVHERNRPGAVDKNVVDRVVNEVFADRVEPSRLPGDQYLGSYPIGTEDQRRLPHTGRDSHHPAECADSADGEESAGAGDELPDSGLGDFSSFEIHTRSGILAGLTGTALCSCGLVHASD